MSEQEASSPVDVTTGAGDISDKEFDRYFESGGKDEVDDPAIDANEDAEPASKESLESKEETPEDEKQHQRNYKAAMHEERENRKQTQKELQDLKAKHQNMEKTFQRIVDHVQWQAMQDQKNAQHVPEPSFEEDPLTALRLGQQKLIESQKQLYMTEQQRQQQAQFQNQQQQFVSAYHAQAQEFSKTNPDFKDAYKFLDQHRQEELLDAGYTAQQAQQLLIEDEMAIVAKAFEDGVNPAERIYKVAQRRGYKPASAQKSSDNKMDQLERGLKASKSLSNAGGKSEAGLTLEAAAAMDDEEFAKVDWKKLMKLG